MSDGPNPLLAILDWLASQAPEIREDLCLRLRFYGGQGLPENASDIAGPFLEQLRVNPCDPGTVGRAFQLRSILDFELARKAAPADWSVHQRLIDKPGVDPDMKANMERMILEGPLKQKRWKVVYEEWRRLRSASLTDEHIAAFIEYMTTLPWRS